MSILELAWISQTRTMFCHPTSSKRNSLVAASPTPTRRYSRFVPVDSTSRKTEGVNMSVRFQDTGEWSRRAWKV
ncbi:hypothetical protein BKA80DRAFT_267998 [Phyllosticta citrichinensis]